MGERQGKDVIMQLRINSSKPFKERSLVKNTSHLKLQKNYFSKKMFVIRMKSLPIGSLISLKCWRKEKQWARSPKNFHWCLLLLVSSHRIMEKPGLSINSDLTRYVIIHHIISDINIQIDVPTVFPQGPVRTKYSDRWHRTTSILYWIPLYSLLSIPSIVYSSFQIVLCDWI